MFTFNGKSDSCSTFPRSLYITACNRKYLTERQIIFRQVDLACLRL